MSSPSIKRVVASLLVASSTLFASLEISEGFVPKAIKPVPEDRWTYGYGSTFKADGSPVKPGDTISRIEARKLMELKVQDEYQPVIHGCTQDILLSQGEFDALIDLGYNIGAEKVCRYSIIRKFREGQYAEGCATIFTIDMLNGKHCRIGNNIKMVPGCKGIMNRRQKQYDLCMGNLYG